MANDSSDPNDHRGDSAIPDRAAEAVEEALARFRDLLTPGDVAESRELLLDVLAAHPVGRLLAERVRERRRLLNSCEHPTIGATAAGEVGRAGDASTGEAARDDATRGKGKASGGTR